MLSVAIAIGTLAKFFTVPEGSALQVQGGLSGQSHYRHIEKCSFGQHSNPALSSTHSGIPFHPTLSFSLCFFFENTLAFQVLGCLSGQWYVWLQKELTNKQEPLKETNCCSCPRVFICSGLGESSFSCHEHWADTEMIFKGLNE